MISHDILFHIFTNYLTPKDYFNNLILVCKDWFELTEYEMFWIVTFKNIIENEIQKENDLKENYFTNKLFINSPIFNNQLLQKESKEIIKKYEKLKDSLIVKLLPFKKKKETNQDIYGNVFKNKTKDFIKQINKRRFFINILNNYLELKELINHENDEINNLQNNLQNDLQNTFQNKKLYEIILNTWENKIISKMVKENKLFTLKEIGQFSFLNNLSLMSILLLQLKQIQINENEFNFFLEIFKFLIENCEIKLSNHLPLLLQLQLPTIFYNDIKYSLQNLKRSKNIKYLYLKKEEILTENIQPNYLFNVITKEIKKTRKLPAFTDCLLKIIELNDFIVIYNFFELFKQIKEFKLLEQLKINLNKIIPIIANNLTFSIMKYLFLDFELKEFDIDLFIFEIFRGIQYSSCNKYVYNHNNYDKDILQDFLTKYLFKSTKEQEKYILTFCKEFNIDKNNTIFLCRIFYLFRDTFEGKINYNFVKLLFSDNTIRSESLNKTWRAYEGTFLITLLYEENCNYKVIEFLLDKGALINSETINGYCNEQLMLDNFFIKEFINTVDNDSDNVISNDSGDKNNELLNSNSNNNNDEITLIDEYIRMMRKLIKAGGKISPQNSFFHYLLEACGDYEKNCSKLFKVKDLQKVFLFFENELKIGNNIEYFKNHVMKLYSLKEQQELSKFLKDELNSTVVIYVDWTDILEESNSLLFD